MGKIRTLAIVAVMGAAVVTAAANNVSTTPTEEDRYYAQQILERAGYDADPGAFGDLSQFENQIAAVLAVQDAVLKATPIEKEIPQGRSREPKDVLLAGRGICFDRSRAIEKLLSGLGLDIRHLAVYSTREKGRLVALMTPGIDSHALTEVRTEKGWMVVDSNARWIGLDLEGNVYSLEDIQGRDPFKMAWSPKVPEAISWPLFDKPFTYVIGLYSRHGRFYPPYTPVPDINYAQLLYNVF